MTIKKKKKTPNFCKFFIVYIIFQVNIIEDLNYIAHELVSHEFDTSNTSFIQ